MYLLTDFIIRFCKIGWSNVCISDFDTSSQDNLSFPSNLTNLLTDFTVRSSKIWRTYTLVCSYIVDTSTSI